MALSIADPGDAWRLAGFTVVDHRVRIGATTIDLARAGESGHGIGRWTLAGLDAPDGDGELDGLPTRFTTDPGGTAPGEPHPNGVVGFDHVVVLTPDLERTTAALAGVGLACRRVRETISNGGPMRQAFFRLGATVLEVVSGDVGSGLAAADAPSTWFGLALDVDDLDATAAFLGPDGLGPIKAAVQPGRRIATLRHKAFGLTVPVALMDRHGSDEPAAR